MATSNLKIVLANCQGLRDIKKRIDVLKDIEDIGSEITCLQDTHWLTKDQKSIKSIWTGDCLLNGKRTNARGVAILFKKNFEYKLSDIHTDDAGSFIFVLLNLSELTIRLINIYAPNSDSPNFFTIIKEHIEVSEHDYCLICGDFNLVLDPKKDCMNYKNINNPQARSSLIDVMNTLDLKDVFRCV